MSETKENPRAEIDRIDEELLRLLNERAAIALRVGAVKRQKDVSLCDPKREQEVLARLIERNAGPLDEQNITNIFERIIDESLQIQQRTFPIQTDKQPAPTTNFDAEKRFAFLGEPGTFSEEAVIRLVGESAKTAARPTFEQLFAAIDDGAADYILAPLENTLVGAVHRSQDLLLKSSLGIVAEIVLPIAHFLIGAEGASLETIESVESHPVALGQCERFFVANPRIRRISADDTASSVRRAVESGDVTRAAIGGRRAARIYGGTIIQEHLEDQKENYTRFVLLAPEADESNKGDKISLILKLAHRPGALHDALRPFVRRGIDLLKIESRPIKERPWQYNFYIDLQAPASESELRGALDEIKQQAEEFRFLGRYSVTQIEASEK